MKRLLGKLSQNACALMLTAQLFIPLISGIGSLTGRTLYLFLPAIEHEARAAVMAVLAVMAFASHKKMNRFARVCAALLPPVTFVCGFLAMINFTPAVNRITNQMDVVCIALECALSVCVFFRCAKWSELKLVMGILSFLLLPVVAIMLMFGLAFTGFVGHYESEPAVSPDGKREAALIYIDEGALGGSDLLEVRERGAGVNVLIGRLRALEEVYLDEYPVYDGEGFVSLTWKDYDTLLVGGREVEIDMEGADEAMTGSGKIRGALAGMLALAVMFILPLLSLCGCQVAEKDGAESPEKEQAGQTDGVDVSVKIDSRDVYGVSVEYFVDRKAIGGQACSADPMRTRPFACGEEISFQFIKRDFQEADYRSGTFGLIFSVLLPGEGSAPVDILWEWRAEQGMKYEFVLNGSREAGYAISAGFKADRTELNDLPDGALK